MAFKPFDLFRKRSKMLMAILVLVAMFSFIFIGILPNVGGEGSAVGGWFRRIFGQEEKVFTVDGQGYSAPKADEMLANRMDCYKFLGNYLQEGESRVRHKFATATEGQDTSNKELTEKQSEMRQAVTARVFQQHFQNIQIQMMMSRDMSVFTTNALEFAYYLKKADELGIVMPRNKVMDDLRKASGDTIKEGDLPGLMQGWKIKRSVDSVVESLSNEIRAMMARAVIEAPGGFMSPALSTQPTVRDLWEAWIHLRTGVNVTLIDFSAEAHVDGVTLPSKEELVKYFDKYKHQLHDPAKATPGFKTPKLFELEFIYADLSPGNDARAYYEQKAHQQRMFELALAPYAFQVPGFQVQFGPLKVPARAWFNLELYSTYKRTINRKTRKEEPSIHEYTETAEDLFGGRELHPDGFAYGWRFAVQPPSKDPRPKLEAVNAAQTLLSLGAAVSGQGLLPAEAFTELAATPQAVWVHRREPLTFPLFAGTVASGNGVFPGLIQLFQDELEIKYRPESETILKILADDTEQTIRHLLIEDLAKLEGDLAIYSLQYDAWQRRKKAKTSRPGAPPIPADPPLFRINAPEEKAFDIMMEHGPEFLAKTQGVLKEEPLQAYLERWTKERGIRLFSKADFGKPRSKLDFVKGEKEKTPLGSILMKLFVDAELAFRKDRDTTEQPIEINGDEWNKLLADALIGERLRMGMRDPQAPHLPPPLEPEPNLAYRPRMAMPLSFRRQVGDLPTTMLSQFGILEQNPSKEYALYWKASETDEKTPTFADEGVQEKVEKAWRLEHARAVAKKEADKFCDDHKHAGAEAGLFQTIEDMKKSQPDRVKDFIDLGRYERKDSRAPTGGNLSYSTRKPPSWIQQPPKTLIEDIMKLRKPGETAVIKNDNENHYYVVVLRSREEPDLKSFDKDLIQSSYGDKPRVDGRSYSDWVLQRKSEEYQKEWNSYLWKKLGFDPESPLGKHFQDLVKNTLR